MLPGQFWLRGIMTTGACVSCPQYGTVVFWAMSAAEEQAVLATVVGPAKTEALSPSEVEIDE